MTRGTSVPRALSELRAFIPAKPKAVNAYLSLTVIVDPRDLVVAASYRVKAAENVIEIEGVSRLATHTVFHLATCGADNEIGHFEAGFIRAFGHEAALDGQRPRVLERHKLVKTCSNHGIGALRAFD